MNTLPSDLLNLVYKLSSSLEYYYFGKDPVRCNNIREALITNNWQYINFCIKPLHKLDIYRRFNNPDKYLERCTTTKSIHLQIRKIQDFINRLSISVPHSIWSIDEKSLEYTQKDYDMWLKSSFEKRCVEPVILKLVEHTPFQCLSSGLLITHQPQVGSVCSTTDLYTVYNYVVVNVRSHLEVYVARITHIDKTTVAYDNHTIKKVAKFISSVGGWRLYNNLSDNYGEEIIFDRYKFNKPRPSWS